MPSPSFFESRAPALWPHRWVLGGGTLAVFLLFAAVLASTQFGIQLPLGIHSLFAVFSTAICWLWGPTLVAVWFHPNHGTARIGSPWFLRMPRAAQVFFRWYAAIFLVLWFLVPVLVAVHLAAR